VKHQATAVESTPAAPVPMAAGAASAVYVPPGTPIAERFDLEARSRPTGTPRGEDLFAKLEAEGLILTEKHQHLASPFRAVYCTQAEVKGQLSMSVCEFTTEAGAKEGREISRNAFAAVPNRDVWVSRKSTLTVRADAKSDANDALAKKVLDLFLAA
jgi:hypothetical protein